MFSLVAQQTGASSDPFGGLGTVLGGGVLVGVLGWLMFVHLPSMFRLIQQQIESKDKAVSEAISSFRDEARLIRASHDAIVQKQMELDQATNKELGSLLMDNTTQTRMLAASVGNLAERIGMAGHGPAKV